jgi:phage shock protein C
MQHKEKNMKRLYKSRKYKVIDGVCGGIAEYFDIDPVIVRLIFVISIALGGTGIIAYIIGMIIVPHRVVNSAQNEETFEGEIIIEEPPSKDNPDDNESLSTRKADNSKNHLIFGIILLMIGAFFLMSEISWFHGPFYWIRHHLWDILIPSILILFGLNLILRKR